MPFCLFCCKRKNKAGQREAKVKRQTHLTLDALNRAVPKHIARDAVTTARARVAVWKPAALARDAALR